MTSIGFTLRAARLTACIVGVIASTTGFCAADVSSDSSTATELMRRVADTYAAATRGIIGVRSQSVLTIKAPLVGRTIADDGWFVFVDGELAKSSKIRDSRQPPLHDPFRTEYLNEYTFAYATCADCAPGDVQIAFESRLRDVGHASGRIVVDSATARIVSETETPYRLPWPTQSGALVAIWANVAIGWFPQTISGNFVGRIGPFVGHADYHQTLTSYAHFSNVNEATTSFEKDVSNDHRVRS